MLKRHVRNVGFGLVFGAVVAYANSPITLAQETGVALQDKAVTTAGANSDFELSTGEAKSVEVPATQSKQSAEIHVYGEPRVSFLDASNTAPACVVAEHQLTSVKVRNDCPTPVRVKVVMTGPVGAQDAACSAIEPGAQETVAHLMVPGVTRIDRVENC